MRSERYGRGPGLLLFALVGIVLAGCAPQAVQRQTPELRREAGAKPTIIVMPLDVELGELTAGGIVEPKSEWTSDARKYMHQALEEEAKSRNVTLVDYQPQRGTPEDQATSLDLIKLYRAVGGAVLLHDYIPQYQLPSKGKNFDWSLGPEVAAIARSQQADYALFMYVRDNYASGGRVAFIMVAALLGAGVAGGSQVGYASVVDLKTGDIVWFNRLARASGDLRTPDAAAETVRALVSDSLK
jgi:hypothetical protein